MESTRIDGSTSEAQRTRALARLLLSRGYASCQEQALESAEEVMDAARRFLAGAQSADRDEACG